MSQNKMHLNSTVEFIADGNGSNNSNNERDIPCFEMSLSTSTAGYGSSGNKEEDKPYIEMSSSTSTDNKGEVKPYIEMSGISKRFGSVLANDNVDLGVNRGEIHALLGENGSGKSTLMNMLSGIYMPDSGSISINERLCSFRSPEDAIASHVGMVHQHFKLIPAMTAWENISLGEKREGFFSKPYLSNPFIEKKRIHQKIADIEQRLGLYTDHDKKLYDMSVPEQQTVEILKLLYRGAKTLIFDEPTAVLPPQEIVSFFEMLRKMKKEKKAIIIIITHKLNEILQISDRITVLRKGRTVDTVEKTQTSARDLTSLMVGPRVSLQIHREKPVLREGPVPRKKTLMKVCSINCRNAEGSAIKDMSFNIYGGKILGVAGIAGNGQRELCEILAGLRQTESGSILLNGENIVGLSPCAIKKRGVSMSFVPEDRLGMGLAAGMSITDNILLRSYEKSPGPFVDREGGRTLAEKIVRCYDISTPSVSHPVRKLSGGNIQKVLLGREIEQEPKVLITAYPMRGLDVSASHNIYKALKGQKKKGVAILYLGEDLDVLMKLCDRIMVIHDGTVMGVVDPRITTKKDIGALMLGRTEQAASKKVPARSTVAHTATDKKVASKKAAAYKRAGIYRANASRNGTNRAGAAMGVVDPRTTTKKDIGALMPGHMEQAASKKVPARSTVAHTAADKKVAGKKAAYKRAGIYRVNASRNGTNRASAVMGVVDPRSATKKDIRTLMLMRKKQAAAHTVVVKGKVDPLAATKKIISALMLEYMRCMLRRIIERTKTAKKRVTAL
jgi:simple sugar transport system ATP-binding protein